MITTIGRRAITFRPYQWRAIQKALALYDAGKRRMVTGFPTGSGKTLTAIGLCDAFLHPSQYAIVIVPTLDLVKQTYKEFLAYLRIDDEGNEHSFTPLQVGIIQGDNNDLGRHITIASLDTISKPHRLTQYLASIPGGRCALMIIDECHYGSIGGYQALIDACLLPEYGLLMGYSATPYRSDKQSLLHLFPDDFCAVEDIWDLILEGYLADITARDIVLDPPFDLEIQCKRLGLSTDQRYLYRYAKAYEEWKAWAPNLRTVLFAQDVKDAHLFEQYFTLKGETCMVVRGETKNREEIYDAFRRKEITCLINFGVLTMGTDIKEVECVLIARDASKSKNIGLLTQMIGRGTRLCAGKERLVVLNGSKFDITLMMFKHLIGSMKLIHSVKQVLKEKKEQEEREEREAPPEMRSLSMPLAATGQERNILYGGGWFYDDIRKEYRKVYHLGGKAHTLIAKRLYSGGYQTMSVDSKGSITTICDTLLGKFDALRECQQYMVERQQHGNGEHTPDPRTLDLPVTERDLEYLRKRRVSLTTTVIRGGRDKTEQRRLDNARLLQVMKKRHYYEIVAHLQRYQGAHTREGGHIGFSEREGKVQRWY